MIIYRTQIPERCKEADRLRGEWYYGNGAAYRELQRHMLTCEKCKQRNALLTELAQQAPVIESEEK